MWAAPKDRLELDNARVNRLRPLAADACQCDCRASSTREPPFATPKGKVPQAGAFALGVDHHSDYYPVIRRRALHGAFRHLRLLRPIPFSPLKTRGGHDPATGRRNLALPC